MKPTLFLCLLLPLLSVAAHGQTVIRDSFESNEQHFNGNLLTQTAPPTHNATWEATPNLVILGQAGKGGVAANGEVLFAGRVPIPPDGNTIRLEASVRCIPSEEGKDSFVAIGLGNAPLVNINWAKGIVLHLHPDGHVQLAIHPPGIDPAADPNREAVIAIAGHQITGYVPGSWNRLVLEYSKDSNSVTAWVNEEFVAQNISLAGKSFTPELSYAGFSGFRQKVNEPAVSDFSLTTK